jgi:hypothetical protein
MKMKLSLVCTAVILAAASSLHAETPTSKAPATQHQPAKASAEFERMKTLVGSWQGKADMGQGPIDMTIQYRLIAGGSVLEERVFAGTPNEMLTMYYEKEGKLAMTHYCMFGNRPGMVLKSADDKTLQFDFDERCGINPAKESHMHSLKITFDNADTITTSCKAVIDGKESDCPPTTLKRAKT